ncbi:MAG: potassium channel protein [Candidatus Eisenbacteria sp.]|nr:potassium channel protein [Candidatus Eisenbacteria bacterium]
MTSFRKPLGTPDNRRSLVRSRIARAAAVLCFVVCVGTVGFVIVEGWDIWRSLFFTLVTITTVGYGAEGLSEAGERFTTLLMIGGIGTAAYAFGAIVDGAVSYRLDWRRRMQGQIDRLRDHYVICGFGRIGRTVCERLAQESVSMVVVDPDEDALQVARELGYLTIRGSATEDEVLLRAGVERARGVVGVVNADSDNIVITLSAREINPNLTIIARADDEGSMRKVRRAGATHVVSPYRTGALEVANAIVQPNVTEFLSRAHAGDGGFELGEVTLSEDSPLVGRTIREHGREEGAGIVFVATKRADGTTRVRPGGETEFRPGDVVIIASGAEGIARLSQHARSPGSLAA